MINIIRNFWLFKKDLLIISRLHSCLFAFILTIIGYKLISITNWKIILLNSFLFVVITSSIMILNDIVDRKSDLIRGKTFAYHHHKIALMLWLIISTIAFAVLIVLCFISFKVALFSLLVWIVGIMYSYLQKIYIFQNILVSLCASSPILAGAIYQEKINSDIWLIFTSLCLIIFSREILGDARHKQSDIGYKITIPIQTESKYPTTVSSVNLHSTSIFVPNSVKKQIDIQLRGEYLETHKIISSLLGYGTLCLIPVLGWFSLLPTMFLVMASLFTFLWLISDKNEINNLMSKTYTLYNMGIFSLLILLLVK